MRVPSLNLQLRGGIDPNLRLSFIHLNATGDPDVLPFDVSPVSRDFDTGDAGGIQPVKV